MGAQIPLGAGLAFALKYQGKPNVAVAMYGESDSHYYRDHSAVLCRHQGSLTASQLDCWPSHTQDLQPHAVRCVGVGLGRGDAGKLGSSKGSAGCCLRSGMTTSAGCVVSTAFVPLPPCR